MSVLDSATDRPPAPAAPPGAPRHARAGRRRLLSRWLRLLGPPLGFLGYALYVAWPLAVDPGRRVFPVVQDADQTAAQWFLAHTAHAVAHLQDPFQTAALNAPDGVNLAAQVTMVGAGVPLTPVTLLFGAPVSYLLLVLLGMAGTATAWYWLLAAKVGLRWYAAAVGGLWCGFSQQLMIETTGRNHVTVQVLLPLIIWQVLRLGAAGRWVRRALLLGLLVAWQALIGEETLLLTALGLGVFCLAYAAARPGVLRLAGRYARGLGLAAAVALAILAYPLGRQFFGPGHIDRFPIDLQAYTGLVGNYVGLPAGWAARLPGAGAGGYWWSSTSLATLGLPVALLVAGAALVLRRRPVVLAATAVVVVFALLSQGRRIQLGPYGAVPGPWRLVSGLPLFSVVVPYRLSLVAVAAAGVVLAYTTDAVGAAVSRAFTSATAHRVRRALAAALALFVTGTLLGLAALQQHPGQLPTRQAAAVPRFITSGTWRPYLAGGRTLVSVPVASSVWLDGQRWSTAAGTGFAIPGGYFLGPDQSGHGALFGAPSTWTDRYLAGVAATGTVPPGGPQQRALLLADLRRWHAGVLVLGPDQVNHAALRRAVEQLLGAGSAVEDVVLWDVRTLT